MVQDPSLKLHAKSLRKVLEMSDVVIEVLDARDPVGTRCRAVERELRSLDGGRKKLVLVLNKIGASFSLCPSLLRITETQFCFLGVFDRSGSSSSCSSLAHPSSTTSSYHPLQIFYPTATQPSLRFFYLYPSIRFWFLHETPPRIDQGIP